MNKNPNAVWWLRFITTNEELFENKMPFSVQVDGISARDSKGNPTIVDVTLLDFKGQLTNIKLAVPADGLTNNRMEEIDVDRELAITAHDNIIKFPEHVWVQP